MIEKDYSQIVLTADEQKIFNKFKKSNSVDLSLDEYNIIATTGLVRSTLNGQSSWFDLKEPGLCELSSRGKRFRAYQKRTRRAYIISETRHWITLAVAILSFFLAIVSLIWQVPLHN